MWASDADDVDSVHVRWRALKKDRRRPGRGRRLMAPCQRLGHTLTQLDASTVLLFAGSDGKHWYRDLWLMDTRTEQWTSVRANGTPPRGRSGHTATRIPGTKLVVVFGGFDGRRMLNDVTLLDTDQMLWRRPACVKGSVPAQRAAHSATAVGNLIYVFGGNNDDTDYGDMFTVQYDSRTDTLIWRPVAAAGPAPVPRHGHVCVCVNESQLLLYGGATNSDVLEDCYALHTGSMVWQEQLCYGEMPGPRAGHAMCHTAGEVVLIGGGDDASFCQDVFVLDWHSLRWRVALTHDDTGRDERVGHAAIAIGQRSVLVFGGGDGSGDIIADPVVIDGLGVRETGHVLRRLARDVSVFAAASMLMWFGMRDRKLIQAAISAAIWSRTK